ncbi:MAG: hypothetical protein DRI90_04355, partial [Deltaproteobacteria bacterium]
MSQRALVVFFLSVVFGSLSFVSVASADGLLIGPSDLSKKHREELQARIKRARGAHQAAFDKLAELRAALPDMDAHKRGPYPVITPVLHALGPEAL